MTVFVVSGTRAGIGLEYVRAISQNPSDTVVGLIRSLSADVTALTEIKAKSSGNVHIIECDVASESSIAGLPAKLDEAIGPDTKINTLINNAAISHSQEETALDLSAEALHSHITGNVLGPAKVLQALLPKLADGAVVANVTSGLASLAMLSDGRIKAHVTAYSISKAALNMLTVHQAKQLAGRAVVVCVDPGHVKTEMGGPNAVVEPRDSAAGVLAVLAGLKDGDSGKFLLYTGRELDW